MRQLLDDRVIVAKCRGGTGPGLTHHLCRQARRSTAPVVILIHRGPTHARITVDLRRGTLSPAALARAVDLTEGLYPLAGWGRGGAVASLIELTNIPVRLLPHVVADLLTLFTFRPEAPMMTRPEPVVLQESQIDPDREHGLEWCSCGEPIRRGFDPLIADHLRLVWLCTDCGRIWRLAAAVIIAGTMRPVSEAESRDFR